MNHPRWLAGISEPSTVYHFTHILVESFEKNPKAKYSKLPRVCLARYSCPHNKKKTSQVSSD